MKVLITGAAGFIGFHTVEMYLQMGYEVIGLDNINSYYDVELKYSRLSKSGIDRDRIIDSVSTNSTIWPKYKFIKIDIQNDVEIDKLFKQEKFELVIHLAAQAGVRYSIENPKTYIESNIVGFLNILEGCRNNDVKKLLYASSSSVYGMSENELLSITDSTDKPVSLYAASKKSNELMAYSYSHLYNLKTIGLRLFTVYGPWGRPDMAPFLFAHAIVNGKQLNVFNNGQMKRDFTFIDDIVNGIFEVSKIDTQSNYSIFNIGNSSSVKLLYFIECLEKELNKSANKVLVEMQKGDVLNTWADIKELVEIIGYKPKTTIENGVKLFIDWFKDYYKV